MLAKLIVHAADRSAAAAMLERACAAVQVWPVKTNAAFLARCVGHADFIAARLDTDFIGERIDELIEPPSPEVPAAAVGALATNRTSSAGPWAPGAQLGGFRMNGPPARTAHVYVNGAATELEFAFEDDGPLLRSPDDGVIVFSQGAAFDVSRSAGDRTAAAAVNDGIIRAPMPGRVVQIKAGVGDRVVAGHVVLVLEAMKMEHALTAPFDAIVAGLTVGEGDQVVEGASLARLEPAQ